MSDQEWHEWRAQGLGASDLPAIMGVSKWGSPMTVWADKVGLTPPNESTERQQIGKDAEPFLASVFHRHTGLYLTGQQTWCTHATEPWMRCTPDGFVVELPPLAGEPDDRPIAERLPLLSLNALGLWEAKTSGDFGWPDGPPDVYRFQCQWQMAVTGHERVWLTVGFAGWRIETFEVERDDRLITEMILQADHFWHEHVCTGIMPPVDGSKATADLLDFLWPESVEGGVEVPAELVDEWRLARDDRLDLERQAKAVKADEDRCANAIAALLQEADTATVDGVPVLTYRTQRRAGIDRDRLTADHPDLAAAYATESTFRVLRPAAAKRKSAAS